MLPTTLPIFPLPNVVLFPNVFLPLHIFEPRYREMIHDALEGDRLIGMVLLKPGWEGQYEARPPAYPIGCAGLITHTERLQDGRYNLILRGLEKFHIVSEEPPNMPYRVAHVTPLVEPLPDADRETIRAERRRLEMLLKPSLEHAGGIPPLPPAMPDEDLVNALAQYLEWEPVEKQALLERDGLVDRCRGLIELLEMKVMAAKGAFGGTWKV